MFLKIVEGFKRRNEPAKVQAVPEYKLLITDIKARYKRNDFVAKTMHFRSLNGLKPTKCVNDSMCLFIILYPLLHVSAPVLRHHQGAHCS
jgi:hypothetical protein